MRGLAIFAALSALASASFAASVSSNLEPLYATVGDPLQLAVRVDGAENQPLRYSIPEDGDFVLLDIDSSTVSLDGTVRFDFAVYDTGYYEFPALEVLIGEGAVVETLRTSPYSVYIKSLLSAADTTIKSNKRNWEHEFRLIDEILERWIWIVLVLLLLAAAALLWWWRKKRQKQSGGEVRIPKIVLPPHEIAIQELIALKDRKYPERGMLKEFYSEFSEIIRRYIENRYGFPALEMTTYELEYKFEAPEIPSVLTQRLLPSLREADMVKFAKFIPDPASCDSQLELGFEIVDTTRERAETETAEAKAA